MFLIRPASVIDPYLPSISNIKSNNSINFMAADTSKQRRTTMSANEARISLLFALASQTSSLAQRVFNDLMVETRKYVVPRQFEGRNLEELLMAVPDLETVNFKTLRKTDHYEIREVESYYVAETTMPGKDGFGFGGASQSFNVLAEYLFGKNIMNKSMEMTTPVITRKSQSNGEKMEMTTPVITRKMEDGNKWNMSFVMPSKYGSNLPLPKDSSVRIKQVPKKIVAVAAFSGFVTDEEVARRESILKVALEKDPQFQVKDGEPLEVAQVQHWNNKYEKAMWQGDQSKIEKCLNMFTKIGMRPPEVYQPEMSHQQPYDVPPNQPSDCYIPEPWTGGFDTPNTSYQYHDQSSQWSSSNHPEMPLSSFVHATTDGLFSD